MDTIQNFEDHAAECLSNEDPIIKQTYNSGLTPTTESENSHGSFDCNICFDLAHDPVVTLCGHLYCWACIFKWLDVQSSSSHSTQQKACPVCKANISQSSIIPLYCHGPSRGEDELRKYHHDVIPPRPTACGLRTFINAANSGSSQQLPSNPFESQYPDFHDGNYDAISSMNNVSPTMTGIIYPTIGLLGELVCPRMFGSTNMSVFTLPLPNSYATVGYNSNSRMRRQELQVEKSLSRLSNFLFCCLVLCLLLF